MAIYIGSRYEDSDIVLIRGTDDVARNTVFRSTSNAFPQARFSTYLVEEGDRLDHLAESVYGDPSLWWVIADANPTTPLPDPLVAGTVLKIPDGRDIR